MSLTTGLKLTSNPFEASFTLSTPFTSLKTVNFSAELQVDENLENFDNRIILYYNNQRYSIDSKVVAPYMEQVEISITVKTPVHHNPGLQFEYEHDGNNNKISIKGRAGLSTLFRRLKHVELTIYHDGRSHTNFKTDLTLKIDTGKWDICSTSLDFAWYRETLRFHIGINLPGYDIIMLVVRHNGNWKNFENSVVIKPGDGNQSKLENVYKYTNRDVDWTGAAYSPLHTLAGRGSTLTSTGSPQTQTIRWPLLWIPHSQAWRAGR